MPQAPETIDGWYALHLLYTIDWNRLGAVGEAGRRDAAEEASGHWREAESISAEHHGASALYRVVGHKADLMAVHFRETVEELARVETAFDRTAFGLLLQKTYSYLSVVELSTHGSGGRAEDAREAMEQALRSRLQPDIPDTRFCCFYPMSKLRSEQYNWYMLSPQERAELMRSHGLIGRGYHGRVKQIITGSMGLDDWEWGVDLFSDDPLQFKKIIYEMRFDEVSARYAQFGSFFVGERLPSAELSKYILG